MTPNGAAEAHRAAVAVALLALVGSLISTLGYWRISPTHTRIVLGAAGLAGAVVLVVLHARRGRPSARLANELFLLVILPATAMMWVMDEVRAAQGAYWVPYEPNKLGALAVAMIAPPQWWIGLAAILLIVGSALVHHVLMPPVVHAHMVSGEPLGIFAYGSFAVVLLGLRQRSHVLRAQLEHARTEKLALARLARVAMSLRDLANTPLQTLELVRRALLTPVPRLSTQAMRMQHALERLRRLNDVLRPYQEAVVIEEESAASSRGSRSGRRPA